MAEQPAKYMECTGCRQIYPIAPINGCDCLSPLVLVYSPKDIGGLKKRITNGPENMFRYEPFLPVSSVPKSNIGLTELLVADGLAKELGIGEGNLYLKVDGDPITGTFKGRGVAVVAQSVSEFNNQEYKFEAYGGASTGNLASAIAAFGNLKKLKSIVLVHQQAHEELIQKALSFGAYVLVVNGDYSKVDRALKDVDDKNLNSRIAWININLRPIYSQGSKTVGFEIAEQLGWRAPHNIVHPVAAGLSLWQIYQGLKEFQQFGLINELNTRMHAAQTAACEPVVTAWKNGASDVFPIEQPGKSIAETLCVGNPSNGYNVLEVLKASNGSAISATEDEIMEGINLVSQTTDFKTGPVGGVVVAGAKKQ